MSNTIEILVTAPTTKQLVLDPATKEAVETKFSDFQSGLLAALGFPDSGQHVCIRITDGAGNKVVWGLHPVMTSTIDILLLGGPIRIDSEDASKFEKYEKDLSVAAAHPQFPGLNDVIKSRYSYDKTSITDEQLNRINDFFVKYDYASRQTPSALEYSAMQADGTNCLGFIQRALVYAGIPFASKSPLSSDGIPMTWAPSSLVNAFTGNGGITPQFRYQQGTNHDFLVASPEGSNLYAVKGTVYMLGNRSADKLFAIGPDLAATFEGGNGNDLLTGSAGNDVYLFRQGDGQDIVWTNGGIDTLELFNEGGRISRNNIDLIIYHGIGDSVTIKNWFTPGTTKNMLDKVIMGNSYFREAITSMALNVSGSESNDTLTGVSGYSDFIRGGGGDDFIDVSLGGDVTALDEVYGEDGNDAIFGSNSNDLFYGGSGNDSLDGGLGVNHLQGDSGDDFLKDYGFGGELLGGEGNDTLAIYGNGISAEGGAGVDYIENRGSGNILNGGSDNDFYYSNNLNMTILMSLVSGHDTLKLEEGSQGILKLEGITSAQVTTMISGTSLIISSGNSSLTILDYITGNKINSAFLGIDFDDKTIVRDDLPSPEHTSIIGTPVTDWLWGDGLSNKIIGLEGDDYLWGSAVAESFEWHKGDGLDTLFIQPESNLDSLNFTGTGFNISVHKNNQDLTIKASTGGGITVPGWFDSLDRPSIVMPDGTVWLPHEIESRFSEGVYVTSYSSGIYKIEEALPMLMNYIPSLANISLLGQNRYDHNYTSQLLLEGLSTSMYGESYVDKSGKLYTKWSVPIVEEASTGGLQISFNYLGDIHISENDGQYNGGAFASASGKIEWDYWTDESGQGYVSVTKAISTVQTGFYWLVPPSTDNLDWSVDKYYSTTLRGPAISSERHVQTISPKIDEVLLYASQQVFKEAVHQDLSVPLTKSDDSFITLVGISDLTLV